MTIAPERIETRLDAAVERATVRLLELQHPEGWWVGELESNATMIAQHLFWHHVLGLRTPDLDRKIANELLARQREDGTWSIWFEGPADLSTSIEAYAALRLAGVDPGPRARDYIKSRGGVRRARVFTKCFLALLGQWPWQWIPTVPPELILLPPWAPLSVYDFSCWARQTIVPLSVVMALRPVRPAAIDLREIGARPWPSRPVRPRRAPRRRAIAGAGPRARGRQGARGGRVAPAGGGHRPRRLGDPPARPRSRRLGLRVRERPLPRRRRHRGRRARAPRARSRRGGGAAWPRLDRRDAVLGRRLGRLRRRQRQALALQDPFLRLREGDGRAERGRDRPRARGPRAGAAPRGRDATGSRVAPARAGGRRLVGRPLGREPRLRDRRG